jgi:hypothetical protein
MKTLVFAAFVLGSTIAQAAPETYLVFKNAHSADIVGPHRGIAQHVIGLKEGNVVPAYKADCTLSFRQGQLAQLSRKEELLLASPLVASEVQRDNCLTWGTSSGGDDVCEEFGAPSIDQVLTGELERIGSGEKVLVFCRAYDQKDSQAAFDLWDTSIRGLLLK